MSLTSFINKADVRAKLKPLRPGPHRKIPVAIVVQPRSKRNQMVGAAFDYLLRFELQRQAPHSITRSWTAEAAPDLIWKKTDRGGGGLVLYRDDRGVVSVARDAPSAAAASKQESGLARDVADRARKVIATAKSAHAAYLELASPTPSDQADMAGHAIRLAKLTALVASGMRGFDPTFEEAAEEDVDDLLALLAIVPFNALLHDKTLLLNPVFKEASLLVGGADADLISGDTLVDFKTTMNSSMATENLDELFGYYLLARRQRQADPTFPAINRLALYFARHGYLWTWDASTWTAHPQFAETEEWFFNRAKVVFQVKKLQAKKSEAPPDPDALVALKKQFEANPRLLWVSGSNPQGTEWTITRATISARGPLWLSIVHSGAGPQRILYLEAHRLVADGMLRFDGAANRWRLEMSEM